LSKAVVTNPPYRIATKFIRHALSLGVEYLALLLKADFLNAQERHEWRQPGREPQLSTTLKA
jgi:hypothetical protein